MELPESSVHEASAKSKFDDWSESSTFRRLGPWLRLVQHEVLSQIDWARVNRVLDVACGSGWAVQEAARRVEAGENALICGCDISKGMLNQRIAGNGSAQARFMVASAQSLPFENNAFDAVFCTAAFHHFPIPEEALAEFRRVLRPGGTVLIADTCRDQSLGVWIWDRLHRWFEKGHRMYYRTDELHALLTGAGFESVTRADFRPSFSETRKLVRRASLFRGTAPNASEGPA